MDMEPTPEDRSRRKFAEAARLLKALLILHAVVSAVFLVSHAMQWELIARPAWTTEELEANDERQELLSVVTIGTFLLTAAFFARWILLANRHVRAIGAEGLTQTPGKALLFYFVPFVNLVLPYRGMRELWQASHSPSGWREQPVPALVPTWWTFWLVTNVFGRLTKAMSERADDQPSLILATQLLTLQAALVIAVSLLAHAVVRRVTDAQLAAAPGSGQPGRLHDRLHLP